MTTSQLLKYCFFFKGETNCPTAYDGKPEATLWAAEKAICENMPYLVKKDTLQDFAQAVSLYVGKWRPYSLFEVMDVYFEKCPELRSKLL